MLKFKKDALPEKLSDRIEYLYRFQECLRVYHNVKAKELKDGKITKKQFKDFQSNWFIPRDDLICAEILICRKVFKNDTAIDIDIDDIEEE